MKAGPELLLEVHQLSMSVPVSSRQSVGGYNVDSAHMAGLIGKSRWAHSMGLGTAVC